MIHVGQVGYSDTHLYYKLSFPLELWQDDPRKMTCANNGLSA